MDVDQHQASPLLSEHESRIMANSLDGSKVAVTDIVKHSLSNINANAAGEMAKAKLEEAKTALAKFLRNKYDDVKSFAKENPKRFTIVVTCVVLGLASGPIAASILSAVGFTSGGVAAGSAAAAWQSSMGAVAAGSTFAWLQSIAATGAVVTIGYGIGVPVAAFGAAVASGIQSGRIAEQAKVGAGQALEGIKTFGENTGKAIAGGATVVAVGAMVAANFGVQKFQRWTRG